MLLSTTAAVANAVVLSLTAGANGASLMIWSWGPSLVVALGWAAQAHPQVRRDVAWTRLRDLMIFMYVVVTLLMAALPYAFGWRGSLVVALMHGNLFHLIATAVGAVAAVGWRRRIAIQMTALGRSRS